MTNETTASQPKSIGDDAQFRILARAWRENAHLNAGTTWADLVAHIDNFRAPAAQAYATIQAAPDLPRLPEPEEVDNVRWAYSADQMRAYGEDCRAATIQEPVMVAEPVAEFAAEVYTAMRCFDGTWGQGSNEMRRSALEAEASRLMRAPNLAAPMVADPAGVPFAYVIYSIGAGKHHVREIKQVDKFDTEGDWKIDDDGLGEYWAGNTPLYLAATVKAVPSNYHDAYRGARDDLADWKRRALEAERKLAHALDEINGPTFMGEPVKAVPSEALDAGPFTLEQRMPPKDTDVLIYWPCSDGTFACAVDEWSDLYEDPIGMGGPTICVGEGWMRYEADVTHWAPIPVVNFAAPLADKTVGGK